jgi:hypothetical protein
MINPRSVQADIKEIIAQKGQLRDLIANSKQTFFNYMTEFQLDGYSLVSVYKQFI